MSDLHNLDCDTGTYLPMYLHASIYIHTYHSKLTRHHRRDLPSYTEIETESTASLQ